jgi:hypothetical protein
MRPASEAFVDWATLSENEVRRMKTNAATRRIVQTSQLKSGWDRLQPDSSCVNKAKELVVRQFESNKYAEGVG